MRRRRILVVIAAGLAVVGGGVFGALLWAGRPVDIERDLALPFDLEDGVRQSLGDAVLAPSSHNAQMWQISVDPHGRRITLGVDAERQLHAVDPQARESYISLGALAENLQRSLVARGYRVELTVNENDSPGPGEAIVAVDYEHERDAVDQTELDLFEVRHSDKSPYSDRALPSDVVDRLLASAPGAIGYHPDGSRGFAYLTENVVEATAVQNASQPVRDELADWLRYSDAQAREHQDGLPAEQLGITGLRKALYYLMADADTARGDEFAEQGLSGTRGQVAGCAGFAVVTGGGAPADLVRAGMDLEAFWLEAAREGVSVQAMSAILEEEPWSSQIAAELGVDNDVQMVLRLGYVDSYGVNHGIRRDLAEVVTLAD